MIDNRTVEMALDRLCERVKALTEVAKMIEEAAEKCVEVIVSTLADKEYSNTFVDNMEAYINTLPIEEQDEARLMLEDLKKMAQENGGFADIRVTNW